MHLVGEGQGFKYPTLYLLFIFLCLYIGQIGNKRRKPENMQHGKHGKDGTYAKNRPAENHLVEKEKKKQKHGKDR